MRHPIARVAAIACIMTQMACSSSGIKNITLERNIDLRSVDLTKYSESGFLVTPHGYGGDYDALAFIQIEGQERVVATKRPSGGWKKRLIKVVATKRPSGEWKTVYSKEGPVTWDDVLEVAVSFAKEIGGDAITGIQWSFGTYDYSFSPPIPRDNVQLTGWAIKRADRETDGAP
jgi:hypothetical protein